MAYHNDPNFTYPENPTSRRETDAGSFTATTWASLAFIALLFGAVPLWAYQSGDMENAAINKPGAERSTTTGQSSVPSKAPAMKDTAQ